MRLCVCASNCVLPINKLCRSVRFPKVAGGCLIVSFLRGCGCHMLCRSDDRRSSAEESSVDFCFLLSGRNTMLLFATHTHKLLFYSCNWFIRCVCGQQKKIVPFYDTQLFVHKNRTTDPLASFAVFGKSKCEMHK